MKISFPKNSLLQAVLLLLVFVAVAAVNMFLQQPQNLAPGQQQEEK